METSWVVAPPFLGKNAVVGRRSRDSTAGWKRVRGATVGPSFLAAGGACFFGNQEGGRMEARVALARDRMGLRRIWRGTELSRISIESRRRSWGPFSAGLCAGHVLRCDTFWGRALVQRPGRSGGQHFLGSRTRYNVSFDRKESVGANTRAWDGGHGCGDFLRHGMGELTVKLTYAPTQILTIKLHDREPTRTIPR